MSFFQQQPLPSKHFIKHPHKLRHQRYQQSSQDTAQFRRRAPKPCTNTKITKRSMLHLLQQWKSFTAILYYLLDLLLIFVCLVKLVKLMNNSYLWIPATSVEMLELTNLTTDWTDWTDCTDWTDILTSVDIKFDNNVFNWMNLSDISIRFHYKLSVH